jgi:hypothetical protein
VCTCLLGDPSVIVSSPHVVIPCSYFFLPPPTDRQGFTWDYGGHVIFSHYEYFSKVLDHLQQGEWNTLEREAWVWMRDRFVPYPFQNNVHRLPEEDLQKVLDGLLEVERTKNAPSVGRARTPCCV